MGISEDQIRFLDVFLTWAAISDSEPMAPGEQGCWRENWHKVTARGREVGLELQVGCHGEVVTLQTMARRVFAELAMIAEKMDDAHGGDDYRRVCSTLSTWVDDPELTLSGQLLAETRKLGGIGKVGTRLGDAYQAVHQAHHYRFFSEQEMENEVVRSRQAQQALEDRDEHSFEHYLADYFAYLNKFPDGY